MQLQRKVAYSIRRKVEEIFESGTIWSTPFTVYDRSDWSNPFSGSRPFIFVVDEGLASGFRVQHLPVIIVELARDEIPIGLGGEHAAMVQFSLHVFARNRAERRDVQDSIIENLVTTQGGNTPPSLALYDLASNGTASLSHYAMLIPVDGAIWTQTDVSVSPFTPSFDPGGQTEGFSGMILSSAIVTPNY